MERSGIREIFDLANTIPDVIHLEMGEPDFPTPTHIRLAAAEAAEQGFTKYTPNAGIPELREATARKVAERNGFSADAGQVVITPGAIASLYGSLLALCNPGDEVLVSDPAWPNYRMIGELQRLSVRRYPLHATDRMQPRAESIEPLITPRTKAIIVNTPSNPVGTVIEEAAMRELVDLANAYDLCLIADEVYDEIVFDGHRAPSAASFDTAENVISVYSFSKTYAMTGWRVGYCIAPADMADLIVKTQEPTTACVNAPAQMAALAALEGPQECVAEMRSSYQSRRDRVARILDDHDVTFIRPDGAFYMWIDVSPTRVDGDEFARALLIDRKVAVTPGSTFGPGSDAFIRVSLATKPEDLYAGVERLASAVAELRT